MRIPAQQEQAAEISGTALGVVTIAAFVALPTGLPMSEVLARWLPALHTLEGPLLPVAVTLAIWGALSAWLMAGAVQHARREV